MLAANNTSTATQQPTNKVIDRLALLMQARRMVAQLKRCFVELDGVTDASRKDTITIVQSAQLTCKLIVERCTPTHYAFEEVLQVLSQCARYLDGVATPIMAIAEAKKALVLARHSFEKCVEKYDGKDFFNTKRKLIRDLYQKILADPEYLSTIKPDDIQKESADLGFALECYRLGLLLQEMDPTVAKNAFVTAISTCKSLRFLPSPFLEDYNQFNLLFTAYQQVEKSNAPKKLSGIEQFDLANKITSTGVESFMQSKGLLKTAMRIIQEDFATMDVAATSMPVLLFHFRFFALIILAQVRLQKKYIAQMDAYLEQAKNNKVKAWGKVIEVSAQNRDAPNVGYDALMSGLTGFVPVNPHLPEPITQHEPRLVCMLETQLFTLGSMYERKLLSHDREKLQQAIDLSRFLMWFIKAAPKILERTREYVKEWKFATEETAASLELITKLHKDVLAMQQALLKTIAEKDENTHKKIRFRKQKPKAKVKIKKARYPNVNEEEVSRPDVQSHPQQEVEESMLSLQPLNLSQEQKPVSSTSVHTMEDRLKRLLFRQFNNQRQQQLAELQEQKLQQDELYRKDQEQKRQQLELQLARNIQKIESKDEHLEKQYQATCQRAALLRKQLEREPPQFYQGAFAMIQNAVQEFVTKQFTHKNKIIYYAAVGGYVRLALGYDAILHDVDFIASLEADEALETEIIVDNHKIKLDIIPQPLLHDQKGLEQDAKGRDFTFCALYLDHDGLRLKKVTPKDVLDPTGHGLEDLKNGILRTVEEALALPDDASQEKAAMASLAKDPKRIIRAALFMGRGMCPTRALFIALNKSQELIKPWLTEFDTHKKYRNKFKYLCRKLSYGNPFNTFNYLCEWGMIDTLFPEFKSDIKNPQIKKELEKIPEPNFYKFLATLCFHHVSNDPTLRIKLDAIKTREIDRTIECEAATALAFFVEKNPILLHVFNENNQDFRETWNGCFAQYQARQQVANQALVSGNIFGKVEGARTEHTLSQSTSIQKGELL